ELLDGTEPMDAGFLTHHPQEGTTYTFTLNSADGRSRTVSHTVRVRTFLFDLSADASEVRPGTPVTISWNLTSLTGGTPVIDIDWPLVEVTDGSSPFEDITVHEPTPVIGTNSDAGVATVSFPAGFATSGAST